jgi:hypothetical protein
MDRNTTIIVFKLVHYPMAFGQNLNSKISCTNLVDLEGNMNRNLSLMELSHELLSHYEDNKWHKCRSVPTSFICGALPNNNSPHINREYQNCVFLF